MDGLFAGVLLHCSLFMGKESLLRANWYPTTKKTLGPRPPPQLLLFVQGVCVTCNFILFY